MRKIVFFTALILLVTAAGCTKLQSSKPTLPKNDSPIYNKMQENTNPQNAAEKVKRDLTQIDLDITKHSSTMVYAEIFNMLIEPETYEGKTIRMTGLAGIFIDERTNETLYSCIVMDATACCAQGIEFILDENSSNYPEENQTITIRGVFENYKINGFDSFRLKDAIIE